MFENTNHQITDKLAKKVIIIMQLQELIYLKYLTHCGLIIMNLILQRKTIFFRYFIYVF